MNTGTQEAIRQLRITTDDRMIAYPSNPFFEFAHRELDRIEYHYKVQGGFDREFYDTINIGLMCARELEASDWSYCDLVYNLLERIRKET